MGWTSYEATYYKNDGSIDRKKECDAYFMEGLNRGHFEVLKSTMVGSVYYAAVKYLIHNRVIGEVMLTQTQGREFSYKTMSEDMLPYCYDCPESILKLLSETTDECSLEWREECRKKAAADKSLKQLPIGAGICIKGTDKPKVLIKMPPMYQFKKSWWMIYGENVYLHKKDIPSNFEILPELKFPVVGIIHNYKGLSETNYVCSMEDLRNNNRKVYSELKENEAAEMYDRSNDSFYFRRLDDIKDLKYFLAYGYNSRLENKDNPDWYCENSYADFFEGEQLVNMDTLAAMKMCNYYF